MTVQKWIQNIVCAVLALASFGALSQTPADPPSASAPVLLVGNFWTGRVIDMWNDKELRKTTRSVVKVEADGYNFESTRTDSNRVARWSTNLNLSDKRSRQGVASLDKWIDFPLVVGKKWDTVTYDSSSDGGTYKDERKIEVLAFEKVKTPAGEFDAFKISRSGWWTGVTFTGSGRNEQLLWYAPAARYIVKSETKNIYQNGSINWQERQELVSFCITDTCKAEPKATTP
jgi:hypothetical protein